MILTWFSGSTLAFLGIPQVTNFTPILWVAPFYTIEFLKPHIRDWGDFLLGVYGVWKLLFFFRRNSSLMRCVNFCFTSPKTNISPAKMMVGSEEFPFKQDLFGYFHSLIFRGVYVSLFEVTSSSTSTTSITGTTSTSSYLDTKKR